MTSEVTAHSLFSGPDLGLLENVVLQHDNGVITDISVGAPPATSPRSLVLARLCQRPRPRAPDRVLVRRARHAPGKLDPPLRARHAGRSLSDRGFGTGAISARGLRGNDDPLHPPERHHAAGGGGRRHRARGVRRRHPHRLCVGRPRQNPVVYGDESRFSPAFPKTIAAPSNRCSFVRRCRRKPISSSPTRSPRPSLARRSTCSLVQPACNGVRNRCWRRWRKTPRRPGRRIHMHLLETIYQRAWADRHFPEVSSAISVTSAFSRSG